MKKISIQFSILLICIHITGCTSLRYKKANSEFANLQYFYAIQDYKKVIEKKDNHAAKIKLANSYRLINDLPKAEPLYAVAMDYPEIEPIELFHYAKVLMYKKDYANAKIWFEKYLAKVPDDRSAIMLKASCDSVNYFMQDTSLYSMSGVAFKEFTSFFGCVPYKNGVVFTADKEELKKAKINPWTGKSYLDLYYAEKDASGNWTSSPLKGDLNGMYHEGPATFNKAGDVIYFTRSNYSGGKVHDEEDDVNTLKLYKAKLVNDSWQQLEELPFNGEAYSVGHPFITKDEKNLYFISNQPGGFGGTDIYKSTFDGNTWSKAENLGDKINTPGNEMFPMMSDDSIFYFSSDAHTNMGGLDVFSTTYDENNKIWRNVENLKYPLNSEKDDFGMVLNNDGKTGYVTSNRDGADKIFEFKKNAPTFNVIGLVTEKGTGTPIEGVSIDLVDLTDKGNKISVLTDKNGAYKFKLEPKHNYSVQSSKDTYFTLSKEISTKGKKHSEDFSGVNFEMEKIVVEKAVELETIYYNLNIYYDLAQWKIRKDSKPELDKLVVLLNDNPTISIEIGSHCDSRAGDSYNLELSEKRAKAVVQYLISNKINKNRLKGKGYGETKLVNKCSNDVPCSEEEHQQNRRTEFKVIKIDTPEVKK